MIVDDPISSMVIEKSVPRTPIVAVGVFITTFCLEFFAICPEAYFTVPSAALSVSPPVCVDASYTNSSITSLECSVTSTRVSSTNCTEVLPLPVLITSCMNTSKSSTVVNSSPEVLVISPLPLCSMTAPIVEASAGIVNHTLATNNIM